MGLSSELKKIKKLYGEEFMHYCRQNFPTILDEQGELLKILQSIFAGNSKIKLADVEEEAVLKDYIYAQYNKEVNVEEIDTGKTPYELLDEKGYTLYECRTEDEIQSYKRYYYPGEELCTFNGGRLKQCICFFAVRKNVDDIKREDFPEPEREDEYGTSVMGIQFNKRGTCVVSIKNRYNHTVSNPDATYGNNLDRIIPGLSKSFEKLLEERGLELKKDNIDELELEEYVVANDGKYYKYNYEMAGIYYCPGNIVIKKNEPIKLGDSSKVILMNHYVLDLEKKEMRLYDEKSQDSFIDAFGNIEKIEVTNDKEISGARVISIKNEGDEHPAIIKIDSENRIIEYKNENVKKIGDRFMIKSDCLRKIELPNVTEIGNHFLSSNRACSRIDIPNVRKIGDWFMSRTLFLDDLNLKKVEEIGNQFMYMRRTNKKFRITKYKKNWKRFYV